MISDMLSEMSYAPRQGAAETKRLRAQNAGNPAMQQSLAVDDRFHQGEGMMRENPMGALASLLGSVPYDAAKMAYFNGPKPVKNFLGRLSERIFPGEGFNDETTSRPDLNQYRGMISGMMEGWRK